MHASGLLYRPQWWPPSVRDDALYPVRVLPACDGALFSGLTEVFLCARQNPPSLRVMPGRGPIDSLGVRDGALSPPMDSGGRFTLLPRVMMLSS
jgi:hypothetical protein